MEATCGNGYAPDSMPAAFAIEQHETAVKVMSKKLHGTEKHRLADCRRRKQLA